MKPKLYESFPSLLKEYKKRWCTSNPDEVRRYGEKCAFAKFLDISESLLEKWLSKKNSTKIPLAKLETISTKLSIPLVVLLSLNNKGKIFYDLYTQYYKEFLQSHTINDRKAKWLSEAFTKGDYLLPFGMTGRENVFTKKLFLFSTKIQPNWNFLLSNALGEARGFSTLIPCGEENNSKERDNYIGFAYFTNSEQVDPLFTAFISSMPSGSRTTWLNMDQGFGKHILYIVESNALPENKSVLIDMFRTDQGCDSFRISELDKDTSEIKSKTLYWDKNPSQIEKLYSTCNSSKYLYSLSSRPLPDHGEIPLLVVSPDSENSKKSGLLVNCGFEKTQTQIKFV